ncbi:hypothetical protein LP420_02260 [Massilia sp. B-10]|nr:hypothetical protein LP420_02260 [Massilia sp. B-10]
MTPGFPITFSISLKCISRRTRFFCRTAAAACALFLGAAAALSVIGLRDQVVDTDLAIIPGNTVFPDGTLSPRLRS